MPDTRSHRGAHAEDAQAFAADMHARLRAATAELAWLLSHGYSDTAALTLVGDHHQLTLRQRRAVRRAACRDDECTARRAKQVVSADELAIDGFNCLITVEAMMSHAPVFLGRDGALRDLASVHGTYRKVEETLPALQALRTTLEHARTQRAHFYLDRPVGNSGRLRGLIDEVFVGSACQVVVSLHDAVDPELVRAGSTTASSDSWVLDRVAAWVDLPRAVATQLGLTLWLVDLQV
jgi:hypothetical protein